MQTAGGFSYCRCMHCARAFFANSAVQGFARSPGPSTGIAPRTTNERESLPSLRTDDGKKEDGGER